MKVINKDEYKVPDKLCKCGCGRVIPAKDRYGRNHDYISGHNGRKYEDPKQYKREWNHRNRESRYILKISRGWRLKAEMIILYGGKCKDCGLEYNGKNGCVFQFHHKIPAKKSFPINARTLNNYSKEKILNEAKKCVLLCANCHFIKHNKQY
jgi:hypothetical protein